MNYIEIYNEKLSIIPLVLLLLIACNSESEYKTEKLTISQLKSMPYYQTFNVFWDKYAPLEEMVDSIKTHFDTSKYKLVFFLSPTCYSCGNADSLSPYLIKSIYQAEISESAYEIYSMPNYKSSHPYDEIIHLTNLPTFWLFKNNLPVNCVSDSFKIHKETYPESTKRIETFLYEALTEE